MLSMYPACFFKEISGYSVIFPDLDLATCGETLDEAMVMAIDCLAGRLRWLNQDNSPIPKPSSISEVDLETVAKEHFDKSVRKTLTIAAQIPQSPPKTSAHIF